MHGELGSLVVPDPNQFSGAVRLQVTAEQGDWRELEASAGYVDSARGVGLLDFVRATPARPARASGEMALHTLEVMMALLDSADQGRRVELTTTAARPLALELVPRSEWIR